MGFAADLTVKNMDIQFDISHVESYRQSLCQTADSILRDEIPTQLRKIEDILQGQKLKSNYQQVARQYSIESIAEFKEKLEEIAEKQRDQQADMEKALEMLFGKPKANNKEEEKGLSASVSKNNSKINLHGSRKRSSTGVVLESAKSNVSVELKISDSAKNLATKKASQKLEAQGGEEEEEEVVEIPEIETNEPVLNLFAELKPLILQLSDTCVNLRNWIVLLIPKAEDGNNFGVEVQEQCLAKLIEVE